MFPETWSLECSESGKNEKSNRASYFRVVMSELILFDRTIIVLLVLGVDETFVIISYLALEFEQIYS